MTGNYLITTDNWFLAPDGLQYKAVYGNVEILEDNFLGIRTNARTSNWFAKVGSEENHVIVAGCQIHYAVKCKNAPNTAKVMDWTTDNGDEKGVKTFERPTQIYDTTK